MKAIITTICGECKNEKTTIEDIKCNLCGKSLKVFMDIEHKHYNYEGLFAEAVGGFGSWFDETVIEFDLCLNCLKQLVESFKIPAVVTDLSLMPAYKKEKK